MRSVKAINSDMSVITVSDSLFILFLLASYTGSVSCQRDVGQVYFGTGTNGSNNGEDINNYTIVLGGLFSIHINENNMCDRIHETPIQYVEAMVLTVDRINNDDKLLPGVTLAYEMRDTCVLPNYALEQTLRFITERKTLNTAGKTVGVSGVVGTAFSSTSIAVAS